MWREAGTQSRVELGRFCARAALEFQSELGADGGWLFGLISSQAESRQGSGRHFLVGSVPVRGNRDGRGADSWGISREELRPETEDRRPERGGRI